MRLEPERLHPNDTLLCMPDNIIESEPVNEDNVIQALLEEVACPINQMTLADILHSCNVDTHTVLNALTEYFHDTESCRG